MSLLVRGFVLCLLGLPTLLPGGEPMAPQAPLMTRWAREVSPEKVHAEYPRPQLVRREWLNLNGYWDFALTSQHAPEPQAWISKILVPFPVESALSGVKKTVSDAHRLWYHRTFTVPAAWQGRRVLLHFGAADWESTVSVNGKQLGTHRGGYDAFSFDVTDSLKPSGTNDLVVGVWDPADAGAQPRGKQVRSPRGIWYTGTSGLWQTVWLEPVAPAHIESVKIIPDLGQSTVTLEVSVIGGSGQSTVKAEALDGAKVVQAGEVSVEGSGGALKSRLTLKIPNAKPWSPDSPFLYGLRVGLYGGARAMGERRASDSAPSPLNGERAGVRGVTDPTPSLQRPGSTPHPDPLLDRGGEGAWARRRLGSGAWPRASAPDRLTLYTHQQGRVEVRGVSSPRAQPLSDGWIRVQAKRTATPLTLALSPLRGEGKADATSLAAPEHQAAGQPIDQVESYFGLRKISLAKHTNGLLRLCLNNAPLFQLGPLDQGFWPDGGYTAPSDEALRYDIETMKRCGFNLCRKHVKIEPERWYYWCDKLGLLVWQDMPNGAAGNAKTDKRRSEPDAKQFEAELQALIEGRFNHPSIVVWIPFTEGWGQYDTERITGWVKQLDPTRLVISASGWVDRGTGDIQAIHGYPFPQPPKLDGKRTCVVGEFGGFGLPLPDKTWPGTKTWSYSGQSTPAELAEAYGKVMEKLEPLARSGQVSGAVYTQLTDVEGEINGLMTYDRAVPKLAPATVAAANRKVCGLRNSAALKSGL